MNIHKAKNLLLSRLQKNTSAMGRRLFFEMPVVKNTYCPECDEHKRVRIEHRREAPSIAVEAMVL